MKSNNELVTSISNSTQSSLLTAQAMLGNSAATDNSVRIQNSYRTKAKAGNTAKIPSKLPIITTPAYQNALTFIKNALAYLQPISDTSDLKYSNGTFLYKGLPATPSKLSPLYTDENIEAFNLPLLLALYGIILASVPPSGEQNHDQKITIYYPEFARAIGKSPNISKKDFEDCASSISRFQTVIGIINNGTKGTDILPVIDYIEQNARTHTICFSSPYMMRIIQNVHEASIRRDRNGQPKLKKNGDPLTHPSYSYTVKMDIVSEKNKKAVGIVLTIVTLIEQAGDNTPHIRANTIIDRNPLLHNSLSGQSAGNKNILLKRAFTKAWELLRKKTDLTTMYNNIRLPNFNDITTIPTSSTLNMVFEFPHNGKGKTT